MTSPAAPDRISVYAAGSLRVALPALTAAFTAATGTAVAVRHGPAGLLRERIEAGDRPDLFLSADLGHPARLAEAGLSGPPVLFARNAMVAVAHRRAGATTANLLERMLDPAIGIGTSTPLKDPSGDYAWAIFRRAEALRPGAFARLDVKAKTLVGGTEPPPGAAVSAPYSPVARALEDGTVDLFLGYASGLGSLAAGHADLDLVELPAGLAVGPEYGLSLLNDGRPAAARFALFLLSLDGQALLRQSGFRPVALSEER
ncbi:molybdate transport system substrate-binding protein [Inquilinus ginsengisoli]|uniref:Molybdate transport system substrate-binding protein n=1 Tax=Inquilinus ginsengisoli TaxID=363840 RepID=A0ABU1JU36_9PROT|nr:substrate-binding domain-containing protein [Inquilinus ginsengisoli]MDR6292136.1 molybdate transport system substrate-binding protein [Inquilinus ginsengisoli]